MTINWTHNSLTLLQPTTVNVDIVLSNMLVFFMIQTLYKTQEILQLVYSQEGLDSIPNFLHTFNLHFLYTCQAVRHTPVSS